MTLIDRAMIVVSSARVIADLVVLAVAPEWRSVIGQLAPAISIAQAVWIVSALRRFDQQGPYTKRNTDG